MFAIQSEKEPSVNGDMLTRVGKELLMINENTVSLDNIEEIAIEISKRNGNCLVTLHELENCASSNNGKVCKVAPIWTYPSK